MRSNKRYVAVIVAVFFLASFVIFGRPAIRLVLAGSQTAAGQGASGPEDHVGKNSPKLAPAMQKGVNAGPRIWLQDRQTMVADKSMRSNRQRVDLTRAQPLSLSNADLDQDGFQDLIVGYSSPQQNFIAIYRGNLDAFAPQSQASLDGIGRNEFPSPFLPN